jgi:3-methylfumaryl-CoA hydratase
MSVDIEHLKQWVGRSEARTARLEPHPANALAATLDRDDPEYTD